MKTLTISGHKITLQSGARYVATRPLGRTTISIRSTLKGSAIQQLTGLSYDQSNAFINAFNNEKVSFSGRIW